MSMEMIDYSKVFCKNIHILLQTLGIKQKELGEVLGLKPAGISDIVTGKNSISTDHLIKIATTYGVSIDWLLLDEGEAKRGEVDPRIVQIFKDQRETAIADGARLDQLVAIAELMLVRQDNAELSLKAVLDRLTVLDEMQSSSVDKVGFSN